MQMRDGRSKRKLKAAKLGLSLGTSLPGVLPAGLFNEPELKIVDEQYLFRQVGDELNHGIIYAPF